MGWLAKYNDKDNRNYGKVYKAKSFTDLLKQAGKTQKTTYEDKYADFKYTIIGGEIYQSNVYNSQQIRVRQEITLTTATPLNWKEYHNGKIVLDTGQYGIITSVDVIRGVYFEDTNLNGNSQNYEYRIVIS